MNNGYSAAFDTLEAIYEHQPIDELGMLLGAMDTSDDGQPLDPAMIADWELAAGGHMNPSIESLIRFLENYAARSVPVSVELQHLLSQLRDRTSETRCAAEETWRNAVQLHSE